MLSSAVVTFLAWMADVRTSFFIVRILVGNRNAAGRMGTAIMSHCLGSVGNRSSLCRSALVPVRSSNGRASPVRIVMQARAGLTMVTFLVMGGQCQDEFHELYGC